MLKILLVDDDHDFRAAMSETLLLADMNVVQAADAQAAAHLVQQQAFNLILLDLRMPGTSGLALLSQWHETGLLPQLPVVVLTAHATAENTIMAMRYGARDHLTKPISRQQLLKAIETHQQPIPSAPADTSEIADKDDGPALIGNSQVMRQLQKQIGLAAASTLPVLIRGETGVGKEVVAQSIHRYSSRAAAPVIAINCAAIPHDLLEGVLFGYRKGAFTGASQNTDGAFVRANGGTLFLDEIGDMPVTMQSKLLRVLEELEVTPLGATGSISLDIRIIAATHQPLEALVAERRFRQDLFFRLNVLSIEIAPLRERERDLLLLAEHFLRQANGGSNRSFSPAAIELLTQYHWPGNVRELKNVIERIVASTRQPEITAELLSVFFNKSSNAATSAHLTLPAAVELLEIQYIREALQQAGGNRSEAAKLLGITRQLLYSKLEKYQLQ